MKKNKKEELKTKEEMKQYKAGYSIFNKLPFWLVALFLKYWYFGAVCFFLAFGLGLQQYWFALAAGLGGGAFYDIAVRHILLALDSKNETKFHIMCASKKYYSFPINIIYNVVLFYTGITFVYLIHLAGLEYFGNEPLSFGLIMIFVDAMFLLLKWGILSLISHFRGKNNQQEDINSNNVKE